MTSSISQADRPAGRGSDLSPRARRVLAIALYANGAGVLAYAVQSALGLGGPDVAELSRNWLWNGLFFLSAAICLTRGLLVRRERTAWIILGVSVAVFGGGWVEFTFVTQHLDAPPYPSLADVLWIAFYPGAYVGLVLLLRDRVISDIGTLMIDGALAGLAIGAIAAALVFEPLKEATGGSFAAVATNLVYPLADFHMLIFVLFVVALTKQWPGRTLVLLGIGFAAATISDSIWAYEIASGTFEVGTVLDAGWVLMALALAYAARQPPALLTPIRLQGSSTLWLPAAFVVTAVALLVYGNFGGLNAPALVLACATLVMGFVRLLVLSLEINSERERAAQALQSAHDELEARVVERTAALERLSRQNESILNAAGDGIYGVDRESRITFVNPATARLTGYDVEDLRGRRAHGTIHHTRPDGTPYPETECPVSASLEDGTIHHRDGELYWRKDGTSFPVEFTSTPIVENGEVTGAAVVFKDITERREVERAKDEFTSIVSHELRTPLTSIRGSLGLLQSGVLGPLPERGQRMVDIGVENADRLVRLINDILDIERIKSGTIDMQLEPCDAAELIEGAIEGVAQLAADAQVRLIADAEPAALCADPDRVVQTLTNLISNAVKFSPPDAAVRVSCARRDGDLLFEVRDEGRGIPADKLESIFERFQQVDASDSRDKGGTGLGLAICRTIVENHGGRIWAESEPGTGATFSFSLPALRASAGSSAGLSVLVCDDDAAILDLTGALLSEHGYRPLLASSGEEALRVATREQPDAILLDLLMPGMSGWETAEALRDDPATAMIPVVIVSLLSHAESETLAGGVSGWVDKPFDERSLLATLEEALAGRGENGARVLVVEDDEDLAAVLCATIERHGVQTLHATGAARAVELARSRRPDLVVLDLALADGSGFDVVEALRRDDRLHEVAVVVYTAQELEEADRERLRLGETRFVMKGRTTPAELERRVIGLLRTVTNDREVAHHGA